MTMRVRAVLIGATLLGSTIPYMANAQQFVICVNDFVGCVSHMQVSCAEIRSDPGMQAHANQLCRRNGYSGGSALQLSGSHESGGECGRYKWSVNCQGAAAPSASPPQNSYYVTGRYYCVDSSGRDAGDCNKTTNGPNCSQACSNAKASVGGDPCRQCTNVIDNSKRWNGRVDWIQGGPCTNVKC
jgi:hypothetical protein